MSVLGDKWKSLRSKLNPLFSPGKLKLMFPTFVDCAMKLQKFAEKSACSSQNIIEVRDLFARYTTDIIASVAFGFDNDSINEQDNIFRQMGSKVFKPSLKSAFRALFTFILPQVNKFARIKVADRDVEAFMFQMVENVMKYRETNNIERNDFMQVEQICFYYFLST